MAELRLGDDTDDFCPKCKRLTNHAIVSLMDGKPAKVRCRSCYHEQNFRNGEPPPSRRDLKKAELFNAVLAGVQPAAPAEAEAGAAAEPPKKTKARKGKA